MLVLSRKPNQAIRIDDEISVILLSVQGKNAKIGIQAPAHVEVHREEVYQRIYRALASKPNKRAHVCEQ